MIKNLLQGEPIAEPTPVSRLWYFGSLRELILFQVCIMSKPQTRWHLFFGATISMKYHGSTLVTTTRCAGNISPGSAKREAFLGSEMTLTAARIAASVGYVPPGLIPFPGSASREGRDPAQNKPEPSEHRKGFADAAFGQRQSERSHHIAQCSLQSSCSKGHTGLFHP